MIDLPVKIRGLKDTDKPLILDSWMYAVQHFTPSLQWLRLPTRRAFRGILTNIVNRRPDLFRLIVRNTDSDLVFGWACMDSLAVHFVYVKKNFRGNGLAKELIGPRPWVFSNWTIDCEHIGGITYRPSLFMEVVNAVNQAVECDATVKHEPVGQDCTDDPVTGSTAPAHV